MKNTVLLKALNMQYTDRTPVWMMRQAGRYLPQYRALRAKMGGFLQMCQTPEIARDITLQPIEEFPQLDAAILFSDILTIPDAMGLGLHFVENEGPKFHKPINNIQDIFSLQVPSMQNLSYVFDAIKLIKKDLQHIPLIGFSGSPWTLATYMVEGGSSKDFSKTKIMLYKYPEAFEELLEILAVTISEYLLEQISAGANVVQIFDTWGGILAYDVYNKFSLTYIKKIINNIRPKSNVPIILFTKNCASYMNDIAVSGVDAIGLDWTHSLKTAREQVDNKIALQGNADPVILMTNTKVIEQEVKRILNDYGNFNGHIFNLGHGITPDIPVENVRCFLRAVHEFSTK